MTPVFAETTRQPGSVGAPTPPHAHPPPPIARERSAQTPPLHNLVADTHFSSRSYCFPPNEHGVFKFAIHGQGWLDPHQDRRLPSTPRTILQPEYAAQDIPVSSSLLLRTYLASLFPEFANHQYKETRLCWYTDRPS